MNKLKKPAFLTDKDNKKLKKAVDALLSVPSPQDKRPPKQQKGDSKRRWRMVFNRSNKPSIIEVKD
ncbi:MAG: hypothetical protein R1F54_08730 [Candidatus Zeuxoniibacter abyssi]|nr:MAG: hypothetical protein R1F54_08730 [Candidatus Persebacteraceae bacterium AB1(2)]